MIDKEKWWNMKKIKKGKMREYFNSFLNEVDNYNYESIAKIIKSLDECFTLSNNMEWIVNSYVSLKLKHVMPKIIKVYEYIEKNYSEENPFIYKYNKIFPIDFKSCKCKKFVFSISNQNHNFITIIDFLNILSDKVNKIHIREYWNDFDYNDNCFDDYNHGIDNACDYAICKADWICKYISDASDFMNFYEKDFRFPPKRPNLDWYKSKEFSLEYQKAIDSFYTSYGDSRDFGYILSGNLHFRLSLIHI